MKAIALVALLLVAPMSAEDDAWRSRNDRGNRFEGSRSVQVSAAPVVELIGFHAYRQNFRPNDDVVLDVGFFVPRDAAKARVTAREIVRDEFYWMEPKPRPWARGWNHFGPWPVRDVLRRLQIDSSNLAVLVRLDGFPTGGGTIAPVFITAANGPVAVSEYEAHFVAGKALDGVDYTLTRNNVVLKRGSQGRKPTQTPFTIKLPIGDERAGPMRLDLECRVAGEPPPAAHVAYEFFHQPSMPSPR